MCDVKNVTDLQTVTGYKVAIKYKDNYYSPLAGMRLSIGRIPTYFIPDEIEDADGAKAKFKKYKEYQDYLYQKEIVGRMTLFSDLSPAVILHRYATQGSCVFLFEGMSAVILKVVTEAAPDAPIMSGTGAKLVRWEPELESAVVYAAPVIVSMEEIPRSRRQVHFL